MFCEFINDRKKFTSFRIVIYLLKNLNSKRVRTLIIKLLIPGLSDKLCNPLDDCFDLIRPTNHLAGYVTCRLTQKSKKF